MLSYVKIIEINPLPRHDSLSQFNYAHRLIYEIRRFCDLGHLPVPPVHLNQFHAGLGLGIRPSWLPLVGDLVTRVQLLGATFTHFNPMWPFLSSFPRLQYLELPRIEFTFPPGHTPPAEGIFDGIPLSTL